ncbi:VOC family protein [Thauera sinica]|uniref:VOC family protein n=1 Tax=Thauera sinica TaxID=2665146 RepID=A0ABW1AXZ1_9RHOO|nr:VOC family protein [Thauera sp. K11]ATE58645.1 glyoxalase [Thauera sp. K11]
MASISTLGYMVLGVRDLNAWERFAVDVIGMQAGRRIPGRFLALRMDEREQRLVLEASGEDDMLAAGWEFDTEEALDEYVAQLRGRGVDVAAGSGELAEARRVERLFACVDGDGLRHEFYFGARRAAMSDAFRSGVLKGAFNTGRLGVGHFVAVGKDGGEAQAFYRQVLGVRVSDYIRGEVAPGATMEVAFFHAGTGRHHSVATAQIPFPFPKRIHHIMVEATDMNDVGLAYDRCIAAGLPIEMGLGHHPNDQMFSFYVKTPSGFALEFGFGGIVVDDATWEVKRYSQLSDWGHRHPVA